VYLRMFGACTSCPSSTVTARFMIGNLLRHYYPDDVTDVVRVDDDGDVELGVDGRPLL
jgi:Fe-S cluster biogenesis protein NfuA